MKIRDRIHAAIEFLPTERAVTAREAERRAGYFLELMAYITFEIELENEEKILATSLLAAIYPVLLSRTDCKQITEKKEMVKGHEDYIAAREQVERCENRVEFLKTNYKIFENGHIFYRQLTSSMGRGQ